MIRQEREKEDLLWKDDDKQLAKKKERLEEETRRKAEQLKKKAETKALLEEELKSIKVTAKIPIQKLTRAHIQEEQDKRNKNIENINNPPKQVIF